MNINQITTNTVNFNQPNKQLQIAIMLLTRDEDNCVDGGSFHWAQVFVESNLNSAHAGDCALALHKAPFTCSRCVIDRAMADAAKILIVSSS